MGLTRAISSGNWSNPAIWMDGVLPGVNDRAASNGFTVTIDQNVNVLGLSNAVESAFGENAAMTSNTTPSGIVTSSDSFYGQPSPVFDSPAIGGVGGSWTSGSQVTPSTPAWVAYEFPTPRTIQVYTVSVDTTSGALNPKTWTFEGWDGANWIVLDTRSNITYSSTTMQFSFLNTTAYIKYRLHVTAVIGTNNMKLNELRMFPSANSLVNSVAGGGFVLNSGVTVTTTGSVGLNCGATNLIEFTSNGTSTINCGTGIIYRSGTTSATLATIRISGGGTLNVTGALKQQSNASQNRAIWVTSTAGATLNFTGLVDAFFSYGILSDVSCTINIVGDIYGYANNGPAGGVHFVGGGTLNVTGNVYASYGFNNQGAGIYINTGTLNITGNVYGATNNQGNSDYGLWIAAICNVYITGNIYGGTSTIGAGHNGVYSTTACYINQIGGVYAGYLVPGIELTNYSSTFLSTGPFVSSEIAFFPYRVTRMHLIPTSTTYFEFRDDSTSAVYPGPIPPAARMIAVGASSDLPLAANVRFGIAFGNGLYTGTCKIPAAADVVSGIAIDNTVGSANVISPLDVWNTLISGLNTAGSIGERLKNAATVETTGAQIASFNS